jgi:adenine-specific DNA-methyltransferase
MKGMLMKPWREQVTAAAPAEGEGAPPGLDAIRLELSRARSAARVWSQGIDEGKRVNEAALFARFSLERFAAEREASAFLSAPVSHSNGQLSATARALAETIGKEATKLPLIEALHVLTSLYPSLLPSGERSSLGAFYTPPALVERLLDLATERGADWSTARVLDPASGGGIFLLRAAKRMMTALKGSEPAFILAQLGQRLRGFEIDSYAASLSQNAFEILLAPIARSSGRPVPICVSVCDTLEEPAREQFDLVVGNPPYGRVALTPKQRIRFARALYGHANLYGVFTDIAAQWAKPGGLIAYLTPTSFLGGQYYAALRQLLADEAPPVAIDFVHARRGVFEDVLQETLLALYQKGAERQRVQVHYLHVANERDALLTKNGTVALPEDAAAPWLAPREPHHSKLIAATESMPSRLEDWGYRVSTGPLVWNRFKSQLKERAHGARPLIWAEAVTTDGRFIFRANKKNHSPYFKLERADEWLLVTEPCVLVQRTTAKEQARRLIAAELPKNFVEEHKGVVVENHLNMVRPIGNPTVSPAAVAAVLNSDIVDQVFRCISGSVAVSAFELESIPLPDARQMRTVERLVEAGASRQAIEQALAKLYAGAGE